MRVRVLLGALFAAVVAVTPAKAQWLRLESPNFVVLTEMPQAEAEGAIRNLEQFDAALRAINGIKEPPAENKLLVILADKSSMAVVSPGIPTEILGFYVADADQIAIVALDEEASEEFIPTGSRIPKTITYLKAKAIWQHEYAHHFMFQYFPNAYPKWFVEGYAEYVSTLKIEDDTTLKLGDAQTGRLLQLLQGDWAPMIKVMAPQKGKMGSETFSQLYPQGWLAVHYFQSTAERKAQLTKYLTAISDGDADPNEAFLKATGMSFQDFDAELKRYMNGKVVMRYFKGIKLPTPDVAVQKLATAEAMAILVDTGLKLGVRNADDGAVRRAKALLNDGAGEPGRLAYARAEFMGGDVQKALAALESGTPSAALHTLRGEIFEKLAKDKPEERDNLLTSARKEYAKANKLDPNYVPSLVGFIRVLPPEQRLSENSINVRLLAHQLAPQVESISLETARALIAAKRAPEAIDMLQSVAYRPHGELAGYAAAMLAAVQQNRQFTMTYEEWQKANEPNDHKAN